MRRLADGPLHRGDLRLRGQHHDQPEPAQPRGAEPRAGERVERRQRRLAVRDRVTAQLHLHEDLDDARQEDQPEQAEARLGTQAGRVDQLARPHDRGRQDQPRPDLPDRAEERVRRLPDRIGGQRIKVVVVHRDRVRVRASVRFDSCQRGRRGAGVLDSLARDRRTVAVQRGLGADRPRRRRESPSGAPSSGCSSRATNIMDAWRTGVKDRGEASGTRRPRRRRTSIPTSSLPGLASSANASPTLALEPGAEYR